MYYMHVSHLNLNPFISSHSSQILNQVTPNPSEVKVQTATQNKNMNRSMKFLPRK